MYNSSYICSAIGIDGNHKPKKMSHWSTKIATKNIYVENGIILDSETHEEIGYTAEYIQKAIELTENKNVRYTRISNDCSNRKSIKFYGFGQKKDGSFWDHISQLGWFSGKLMFLIKNKSHSPLSPTERP